MSDLDRLYQEYLNEQLKIKKQEQVSEEIAGFAMWSILIIMLLMVVFPI